MPLPTATCVCSGDGFTAIAATRRCITSTRRVRSVSDRCITNNVFVSVDSSLVVFLQDSCQQVTGAGVKEAASLVELRARGPGCVELPLSDINTC